MHFRPPEEQNEHKITCGVHVNALQQVRSVMARGMAQRTAGERGANQRSACQQPRTAADPGGAVSLPAAPHCCRPGRRRAVGLQVVGHIEAAVAAAGVAVNIIISGTGDWRFTDLVPKQVQLPAGFLSAASGGLLDVGVLRLARAEAPVKAGQRREAGAACVPRRLLAAPALA